MERVNKVGEWPFDSGGFGDVWKGTYEGRDVAIKALRVYKNEGKRQASRVRLYIMALHEFYSPKRAPFRQVFYKEVTIWKRLWHPNIVPFLGVTDGPAPFTMVSEWMPNGNVRQYVVEHPEVDRLQLVRHFTPPSYRTAP